MLRHMEGTVLVFVKGGVISGHCRLGHSPMAQASLLCLLSMLMEDGEVKEQFKHMAFSFWALCKSHQNCLF